MIGDRWPRARFMDRLDAGRQLGEALQEEEIEADIVLAIPRGGLPLGRAVADALDARLDIVVGQKIGAPDNPEFALGAVTADGSGWLNERVIDERSIDQEYVERQRDAEVEAARGKADRYRDGEPMPDLTGRTVVLVDDGVATGATARACIDRVKSESPEHLVLAVPVASSRTISDLEGLVDTVVCLETPRQFRAVGQFYDQFDQVSDGDAIAYLKDE